MKRSDDDTPMQPFEDLSEPSTFTLLSQEKSKSKGKGSVQKKKKKETLARRSFHNAWMVDSQFCYTPEQEAAILAALPGYQDGQSVVRSILRLAREYRSEVEHREEEPLPTAITAQIDHLEKCVEQLQACLWGRRGAPALHGPTLDSIEAANDEDFLGRIGKLPEENFHTLLRHLKKVLGIVQHRVWTAQRVHQTKRGRVPQNEPLLVLLDQLCTLWESCGNRLPTRAFDDRYPSRLRRFCDAVLLPMPGLDSYMEALKIVLKRKHAYRATLVSLDHGGKSAV